MAREIHERENLLRDARALTPRALLGVTIAGEPVDVFLGFRGDALSLYFGDDPAFHFNAAGELRRAYIADQLIKAERGRLVALERKRSADAVSLVRYEFDDPAARNLLANLSQRLADLRAAIMAGAFVINGQEPPAGDAMVRLQAWLGSHTAIMIADSPHAGGST